MYHIWTPCEPVRSPSGLSTLLLVTTDPCVSWSSRPETREGMCRQCSTDLILRRRVVSVPAEWWVLMDRGGGDAVAPALQLPVSIARHWPNVRLVSEDSLQTGNSIAVWKSGLSFAANWLWVGDGGSCDREIRLFSPDTDQQGSTEV